MPIDKTVKENKQSISGGNPSRSNPSQNQNIGARGRAIRDAVNHNRAPVFPDSNNTEPVGEFKEQSIPQFTPSPMQEWDTHEKLGGSQRNSSIGYESKLKSIQRHSADLNDNRHGN